MIANRLLFPRSFLAVLFVAALVHLGQAQPAQPSAGSGTTSGKVSNAGTSAYLEGAVVTLDPGNHSVFTTVTGEYVIPRVPAGAYSLSASYTGLDIKTIRVTVEPNGHAQ